MPRAPFAQQRISVSAVCEQPRTLLGRTEKRAQTDVSELFYLN